MFGTNSTSRFKTIRSRRNPIKNRSNRAERIAASAVKVIAESLERRMLLSASAAIVADINATTTDAHVVSLADLGNGKVVFYANDGVHGEEPYVSDGTAAGTMLLKDINPGPGDSPLPIRGITASLDYRPGIVANGRFFFAATDAVNGYELWSTDGTPSGTALVKDINPGSASSGPLQLVAFGNTVFFVADDGTDGSQLWATDGTAAGTLMLTAIGTSPNGGNPHIGPVFNGRLFFSANDGVDGGELWSTDGTVAGTSMVATIGTSTNSLGLDLVFNGRLYFTTDDGVHGNELWSTDGTAAGTAMVMDINPGSGPSYPSALTICGSRLFFTANDGTHGSELWVTDGTSAGTHLVSDLAPGSASPALSDFTNVNGTLLFARNFGQSWGLYTSDGTSAGTVMIRSFNNPFGIGSMVQYGGRAYFFANDGVGGSGLWQSDGTSAGTTQVSDLAPGLLTVAGSNLFFAADAGGGQQLFVITAVGSAPTAISPTGSAQFSNYPDFQAIGSGLYFTGPSLMTAGQLWHSDGTVAGTGMVKDISIPTIGSSPSQLTEINGRGIFAANDTVHGTELWVTDGSAGGTTLLKDIVPGIGDGLPLDYFNRPSFIPARLGNYLYFSAGTGNGQLWRTDGTANGTTLCLSYLPASTTTGYAGVSQLTAVNGSLYFFADDGTGSALYISNGTPSGTTRLQYLRAPGVNLDQPSAPQFSSVGGEVIFAATDSTDGTEPWVTNGTPAGTMLLADIDPGTTSSLPSYFNGLQRFVNVGPFVYFVADSPSGMGVWKTDGTLANTSVLANFQLNAFVDYLTSFKGKLYFSMGPSSGYGGDIWTSDGTVSGTKSLESFPSNSGLHAPSNLTVVGNTLYFSAAPSAGNVPEGLFASDGTAAGTILVSGTSQTISFSPTNLTDVQGTLYFTSRNAASVSELWRVDQSPQAGMSIEDVLPAVPGVVDPNLANLASLDGTLFFQATDSTHGAELWKLNLLQAIAGGPYLATGAIQLDASASRDPNSSYPLTYSWDLDGDGIFGETGTAASKGNETGVNPTFYANQAYPGVDPVTVQVTGSWQNTATATSYVTVPPRPHFAGDTLTFTLGTAVANAAIQSWTINWGDGSPVENYTGSTTSVSHLFATASGANPFMVQISAFGTGSTAEPLPMPVTIYSDPVLDNGVLTLTGTSGNDLAMGANAGGVFDVGLNGATRNYNSALVSRFVYNDGGGDDQINLRDSFAATLNLSTGNDWISNAGATAIVNPGTGKVRVDSSFGTTTFAASNGSGIRQIQFSTVNISSRAKLIFANSTATLGDYSHHANRNVAVIDAGGLNISSGGTLDLGDNSMLLKYLAANKSATDTMVNNLLSSGYAGGAWSGPGINSSEANYDAYFGSASRAVGWADQFDVGVNSFEGDSADVADGNEIMIKFTYYGDTDLDGKVASSDSANFSTGVHLAGNAYWEFGDFDYSGSKPTASDSQAFSTGLAAYKTFGLL